MRDKNNAFFFLSNNIVLIIYIFNPIYFRIIKFSFFELITIISTFNLMLIIYLQTLYSHIITNVLRQFLICFFSWLFSSLIIGKSIIVINILLFVLLINLILIIIVDYILSFNKLSFLVVSQPKEQVSYIKKIIIEYHKYINEIKVIDRLNKVSDYELTKYDYIVTNYNIYQELKPYRFHNSKFIIIPTINEIVKQNLIVDKLDDFVVFKNGEVGLNIFQRIIKRIFDLTLSLSLVILLSPLFVGIAIWIKIDDGGPAFYIQNRITENHRKFGLIKFRTMIVGAEERTGAVLASENDPRITKAGRFLRLLRLDELPQLFNIIRGDMSIVGPRPERKFFIDQFQEEERLYNLRFKCKAGITGLAQINVNYDSHFLDKLKYDLLYLTRYSLFLDIKICFNTIITLIDPTSSKGIIKTQNIIELLTRYRLKAQIVNNSLVLVPFTK